MRIQGDPDLLQLFRLGMRAMEDGMETVTVAHHRNGRKSIGSFTLLTARLPIRVSYAPASAEGERFSAKFRKIMAELIVPGLTCIEMARGRI